MAARIVLLPAALADQIAAGEVVERPASVVKELVENALDAGARRVEVEIERGGLARIVVADDGEGMAPEDAHLALRRHATSKLRSADQLFSLATFGFRGEALPSIASIAELTLISRRADATAGYAVTVRGGEVVSAEEVGAARGTRVEVRALFTNVPARLKFQKAAGTEASHIIEGLVRTARCAPGVHVRTRVDGRIALDLPPHRSLAERAKVVLGRSAGRGARIASAVVTEGAVRVEAHLGPPEAALQSARRVHLLVNGRAVRDRGLLGAVQVGYGPLLERGRHPLGVIEISIPGAEVDVNVHPQKLEVRLARAAEVFAAVRHAVSSAVASAGFSPAAEPYDAALTEPLFAEEPDDDGLYGEERGRAFDLVTALAAGETFVSSGAQELPAARHLGALPGGYLLFVERGEVLVLDQHAASALVQGPQPGVRLLAPLPLELDLEERATLAAHSTLLCAHGFEFEDDRAVVAHPAWATDPLDALRELLAALLEGGEEEGIARAGSLSALSPAAQLDPAAAHALLEALRARHPDPEAAPRWRGRRALVRVPLSELIRRLET
jgi:DNA mismatch repair protein MutL